MALPIGYHRFHKNKFLNYQLNRWYSLGYSRKEDIMQIGIRIRNFEDYVTQFNLASEVAMKEKRYKHAATYLRASEFLMVPSDQRKQSTYLQYLQLFDQVFLNERYVRHKIPYAQSFLSAIKFPAKTAHAKGTIVGIPGFDAFIEEFYGIWEFFAVNGYDCIAFEGPGQGGSRRLYNQHFDHDYEKPTKAVLDYFGLEEVTAVGISMGGYWIMRSAAFEKRITKVVAMPPVYDWLEMTNPVNAILAKWLLKRKALTGFLVKLKMNTGIIKHTISHALYIQNKSKLYQAVDWMMSMNKVHINSHLVDQDVLLLCGEHDAFQPPILLRKQQSALVNAKSVTTRIFKKSEHADQHCQIGNIGLALETIVKWIEQPRFLPS